MASDRRLQLRGLHHLTAVVADADRTIGFYRDVLGLEVVRDGRSDDDPDARHVWLGIGSSEPGALVSFMEYPELEPGRVGPGSTHHFALLVESAEELEAWRDYLRGRDVTVSEVLERGAFRSLYTQDPDGHVVEITTRGPGFAAG